MLPVELLSNHGGIKIKKPGAVFKTEPGFLCRHPFMSNFPERCAICPRECGANRNKGERGFCGAGKNMEIYSAHLHFGEEPPISGTAGSGTIFFVHCNLRCVYCQNYRFSQKLERGKKLSIGDFADLMLSLQKK
ncbi:MAG: hypothetical protein U9R52_04430 [Candidatus Omnitrophota bacterium]|nr:hypothetical protein [Candidatus Omnitrophota bacterium]